MKLALNHLAYICYWAIQFDQGGGKYLVCGGQDERIKVYNLVDMKIMGNIGSFAHSGAITCLEFFGDSFLITGSEASSHAR